MSLIIVSNRLPASFRIHDDSSITYSRSAGGLVTALSSLGMPFKWIGALEKIENEDTRIQVKDHFERNLSCFPIFLDADLEDKYYNQFSNGILWPLFHYMVEKEIEFDKSCYEAYKTVNKIFAEKILDIYKEGDIVWIHDYHILLTPSILRESNKEMTIGFFLHIPFPSSEIFRSLPVREELLEGVLGSNMIAFHTYDYARHFRTSCSRLLGLETTEQGILYQGMLRYIKSMPIGIDPSKFQEEVLSNACQEKIKELKSMYGNKKIIIGIDRVDYSKGLPQKFAAFERFLTNNKELGKDVLLIQIGVPSRTDVKEYKKLIKGINTQVGKIQAIYGTVDTHGPLVYINKPVDFCTLCALYASAEACIVSSIRDGMNLVSLEFVACQEESNRNGVLIISEFAGASHSLCGSLIVNPFDIEQTAEAIHSALCMDDIERRERHRLNYEIISKNTAITWGHDFLSSLKECASYTKELSSEKSHLKTSTFISFYKKAESVGGKRVFFLDYNGTLVKMKETSLRGKPTSKVMHALKALSQDPNNIIYIFSGRPKSEMESEFNSMPEIGLVSEEGIEVKHPNTSNWTTLYDLDEDYEWMDEVKSICRWFQSRTPNSFLEENNLSCLFHFRNTDPIYGRFQVLELQQHIEESFKAKPLSIYQGKDTLELRPKNVSKERAARVLLEHAIQNEIYSDVEIDKGSPNSRSNQNGVKHSASLPQTREGEEISRSKNLYVISIGDSNADEGMFHSIDEVASKYSNEKDATTSKQSPKRRKSIVQDNQSEEKTCSMEIESMNIAIRDYTNMSDVTNAKYVLHQSEVATILSSVIPRRNIETSSSGLSFNFKLDSPVGFGKQKNFQNISPVLPNKKNVSGTNGHQNYNVL